MLRSFCCVNAGTISPAVAASKHDVSGNKKANSFYEINLMTHCVNAKGSCKL